MLTLAGVAKLLCDDSDVRNRIDRHGFSKLITTCSGAPLATMSVDDCWLNRSVLKHFVGAIKDQGVWSLPSKPQIEDQLRALYAKKVHANGCKAAGQVTEVESIDAFSIDEETAQSIYLLVTSIKTMLRFLKNAFKRDTVPRDRKLEHVHFQKRLCLI